MTKPTLTFRAASPGLPREVAYLGNIVAGEVMPFPGTRHRATWIVHLTDASRRYGPATSFEVAREKVREHVEEWLMRAWILNYGDKIDVQVDAPQKRAKA